MRAAVFSERAQWRDVAHLGGKPSGFFQSKQEILIPIALLGLAVLCYASIIPTYFLSDDFDLIGKVVRRGMYYTWGGFLRPGTVLSFVIDHSVWGLNPIGYHLTNILFHSIAGYCVFLIARRFFREVQFTEPVLFSFLSASLFIALPSHSEAVSWISGRTDVIATALALLSTVSFLSLFEKRSLLHMGMALVLFAAALLTKENVITLPLMWGAILVYYWYVKKQRPAISCVVVLFLSFLLLAAYFVLRKVVLNQYLGGYGNSGHIPTFGISSVRHLAQYVFRTFIPPFPDDFSIILLLAFGFTIGVVATATVFRRKQLSLFGLPIVGLFVICYLFALIPVINAAPRLNDTISERYLYLPSVFACLLLPYLSTVCIPRTRLLKTALLLLIIAQGVALQWVNGRWVTASQLCKQIAYEVSQKDPASTIILNVPDNYRGAWVFRNGLNEASTIFTGNRTQVPYRRISVHGVETMDQIFGVSSDSNSVTLTPPYPITLHYTDDFGYEIRENHYSITVGNIPGASSEVVSLLSFTNGNRKPLLQTILSRSRLVPTSEPRSVVLPDNQSK